MVKLEFNFRLCKKNRLLNQKVTKSSGRLAKSLPEVLLKQNYWMVIV